MPIFRTKYPRRVQYYVFSPDMFSISKYTQMMQKNQIVVISAILILLSTATIVVVSYNIQTAKAAANPAPFGKNVVSGIATSAPGALCVAGSTKSCANNPGGGNSFGKDIVAGANPVK